MRYGTLAPAGEKWRLTYERALRHTPAKVWKALTDAEDLRAWFPSEVHGLTGAGAALRFVFPYEEAPVLGGEVLTFDPPRLLEYTWDEDRLRFELSPTERGCRLVFSVLLDEQGRAARDGAGWHGCLDALATHLDGGDPTAEGEGTWASVHPEYVRRFGPEASTIGPPEWVPGEAD
jgi:uncharacterized protein YndB with AHSA1/START domain